MGSAYAAACKCGYKAPECPISSTRAQHGRQWWYPHACDTCRAVVSIDLLSDNRACPHCGNEDVVSFEEPQPPEVKQSFWDRLRGKELSVPENLQDPVSSSFCSKPSAQHHRHWLNWRLDGTTGDTRTTNTEPCTEPIGMREQRPEEGLS